MVRSLPSFVAFLLLAACRPAEPYLAEVSPLDSLSELERETGSRWTVRWHPDVRSPAFLEGRTPPLAATPQDAERVGRLFLRTHPELFGMHPADDPHPISAETDDLGMTHARFAQRRGQVRVLGGELVLHFAQDGALVRMNGRWLPLPDVPLVPQQDETTARVQAALLVRDARPEVDPALVVTRAPSLVIFPMPPNAARLAWRVEVDLRDPHEPMLLEILVDAQDGTVLRVEDLVDELDGSGVGWFGDVKPLAIVEKRGAYYLEDPSRGGLKTYSAGGKWRLPGTTMRSSDPHRWDDGVAVDAHAALMTAYDYFLRQHGWQGWDSRGLPPRATVHFGRTFRNAFFNGRYLVFADGSEDLSPPAAALDLVAHEYTHAIAWHTAALDHSGEPGTIGEAIADVFACLVSARGGAIDWRIGEEVYHPGGVFQPLRDLADPHATGHPAHTRERVATYDDRGGVHVNSTIVSHAAYLMTEGGRGVRGLGADIASLIWYRALVRYLTSQASFLDLADATLAAARDLGRGEQTVRDAWLAVGVLE